MEVHAHTHPASGGTRKKWTHYLWEFLMLFLAVFCGFLAENQREKIVERHREKDYMISMIEDLQTDTANLSFVLKDFEEIEKRLDFTIRGFSEGINKYSEDWTKQFILNYRHGFEDFYQSDRTIHQLKNAGGMRLIINKEAAMGIIKYDAEVKDLDIEVIVLSTAQNRYIQEIQNMWSLNKMFADAGVSSLYKDSNIIVHKNYWITKDPFAFEHLFNQLSEYNETVIYMNKKYNNLKLNATGLIELLKKEYHLD